MYNIDIMGVHHNKIMLVGIDVYVIIIYSELGTMYNLLIIIFVYTFVTLNREIS